MPGSDSHRSEPSIEVRGRANARRVPGPTICRRAWLRDDREARRGAFLPVAPACLANARTDWDAARRETRTQTFAETKPALDSWASTHNHFFEQDAGVSRYDAIRRVRRGRNLHGSCGIYRPEIVNC